MRDADGRCACRLFRLSVFDHIACAGFVKREGGYPAIFGGADRVLRVVTDHPSRISGSAGRGVLRARGVRVLCAVQSADPPTERQ